MAFKSTVKGRGQKILIGLAIAFVAGLFALGFFAAIAVYGWKKAIKAGNETATIQNMRTIAGTEVQYFRLHSGTFATLDQLIAEQMLTSKFAGNHPVADGYVLTLKLAGQTDPGSSYTLNGDPVDDDYRAKHFYLDSSSAAIHVNPDKEAGPNDPLLPDGKR